MNEDLQQALETGTITAEVAKGLEKLTPGSYCQHKSWGFGKIAEWQLLTGQIIIDFDGKKGHVMQPLYAVQSLLVIPHDDIRARVRHSKAAVEEETEKTPIELLRSILTQFGGKATVDQIKDTLVPAIFELPKFKRWWEATKKKLKADGHFHLPTKKTDPIELLDTPVAAHTSLIAKFRSARYLKDQISALDHLMKSLNDFAQEVDELKSLVTQIEDAASKGRRLQAAQAIELLLARDEILNRHKNLQSGESSLTIAQILIGESSRLPDIFAQLPAPKQRLVLDSMEEAFAEEWVDKAFSLMLKGGPRLAGDINKLFELKECAAHMQAQLSKWIGERGASSDILYWLCKERGVSYKELFNPSLFGAVLAALEMDQLSEAKKSMRLRDLIIDDQSLLSDFFIDASPEVVRDALRRLLLTTVFDDLNQRSLIGRMIKQHPYLQVMVSGDSDHVNESLTVSWASLERRKYELDDLINRQIPQNVRDIQIARDYGDLRENFEFKSAKEQQAVLGRRKSELELALMSARGTNFENPDTSAVSIGTTVVLEDLKTGKSESYSILGAWDSAPEHGVISYKAAIGQTLLGHKVGDKIAVSQGRTLCLKSISPFKNLDLLAKINKITEPSNSATK